MATAKRTHKKTEDKKPAGAPLLFPSEKHIIEKWEEYKEFIKKEEKPVTWAGMAFYLGCDRKTLYNYRNNEEYFHAIKKIQNWLMMECEQNCIERGSGAIFIAKNYGYTDTQQSDTPTETEIKLNVSFK